MKATQHERTVTPDACCYSWSEPGPGGRPLQKAGALLVSESVVRDDWGALASVEESVSDEDRALLAEYYLNQGAAEHASARARITRSKRR